MVNLTGILLRRNRFNVQCDAFWKKRQTLKLSAHFYGRSRNCYSIAVRAVHKSLLLATKARRLWKLQFKTLWGSRITAGSMELGYIPEGTETVLESLAQSQILLNRQMLSELAVWEPRTFKAINKVAASKAHDAGMKNLGPHPFETKN